MPFASESQRRLFHVKEEKGEIPKSTVEEWEHATKNKKDLPYHKGSKKACEVYGIKQMPTFYTKGSFAALDSFGIKTATPRYEREIAAGNIPRQSVAPVTDIGGPLGPFERGLTRRYLAAPASVDPAQLERTRAIREHLFQNLRKNPAGIAPNVTILPNGPSPATISAAGFDGAPTTATVMLPENSAAYLANNGKHPLRGIRGEAYRSLSILKGLGLKSPWAAKLLDHITPKTTEADRGVGYAVARHELGEASAMQRPWSEQLGHATHAGTAPQLEERLNVAGDPRAIKRFQETRQHGHPDDALMDRLIRNAGGTADAPLPLGGRNERSLQRGLIRNVANLSPGTRLNALRRAAMSEQPNPLVEPKAVYAVNQLVQPSSSALSERLRNLFTAGKFVMRGR